MSSLVFPMAKRMLQNEEAARDAVQISMMKLWENRKKLGEYKHLKAFVFTVVRNTCLDELKRKKADSFDEFEAIQKQVTETNNYDNIEAVELVKKLVNELPDGQKEVLQMRDIDGLEFNEIAEIMNCDLPYIRVLLSRARKNIKEKLIKIYAYETNQ